jgi:hypothetical protein
MRTQLLTSAAFVGLIASVAGASAVPYTLTPGAEYAKGCFGPCLCPVAWSTSVTGTFDLTATAPDPLYQHFDISNVNLIAMIGDEDVTIVGSGTYKVGGRVALLQRMELDLSISGDAIQHFDSGWTPVTVPFPALDVETSMNGLVCFDTLVHIAAAPSPTPTCDLDGDGQVGASDLAILLGAWGSCVAGDEQCAAADFNDDGKVDATDLSLLLGQWS